MKFFKFLFKISLIFIIFILIILIVIGTIAYIDWNKNKDYLLSNLSEYYNTIKNAEETKKEYVILDDEGNIIEIEPTKIYDRNNNLIGVFSPSKRKITQFYELPDSLIKSLIYIEDRNFYKHYGFSIKGIIRATLRNILNFKIVEGGSTITQQLSKILFTSRKKTFYRKFLELYGAISIEKKFKKDEILLMYLNTVYLGHGCYGFKSASELYFKKDVRNLNIFEQSLLISLIPSPNNYSPFNNPQICKKKHFIVLSKLAEANLISKENLKDRFENFWNQFSQNFSIPNISFWKMELNKSPYAVEYVRRKLLSYFTPSEILQGGLKVYTTIDLKFEDILREIAKKNIEEFIQSKTNKDYYKDINAAIIIMEPKTGDVLGFIGGLNFTFENQLNRAFDMKRPVGSTIKPIIYASAFDTKLVAPVTFFTDKIIKYTDKNRIWIPRNYDDYYRGTVFLKDGLVQSINTVSVQLLNLISPEYFVEQILKPSFDDISVNQKFLPVLSLALGSCELSPFEVSILFSILANGGEKIFPLVIKYIANNKDEVIIDYEKEREKKLEEWRSKNKIRIFSKSSAFITSWILKDVFKKNGTAYNSALRKNLKLPIAGKTGTTQDYKDAWFSAFSPEYVVSVWAGFDDYKKSIGKGATGGVIAAPIAIDIFNQLYLNKNFKDFEIPTDEIVFCDISKETGKLANSNSTNIEYNVPFIKGTEPKEY